jgi:hypothetical protein
MRDSPLYRCQLLGKGRILLAHSRHSETFLKNLYTTVNQFMTLTVNFAMAAMKWS